MRPFDRRIDRQGIVNRRQIRVPELGIERRPDDLRNSTNVCSCDHVLFLFQSFGSISFLTAAAISAMNPKNPMTEAAIYAISDSVEWPLITAAAIKIAAA